MAAPAGAPYSRARHLTHAGGLACEGARLRFPTSCPLAFLALDGSRFETAGSTPASTWSELEAGKAMSQQKRPLLRRTTEVLAPADEVFAYFANPEKLPEIWPSLIDVRDIVYDGDRPVSYAWTYKMAGVCFDGSARVTEYEPDRSYAVATAGGIHSLIRVSFLPHANSTVVHEEVEYEIPIPLLGRFAHRFVRRINEKELESIHANLKARLDAEPRVTGRGSVATLFRDPRHLP